MSLASSTGPNQDQRWWTEQYADDRGTRLTDVAGQLYRALQPTRLGFSTFARIYSQTPTVGLTPRLYRNRAPAARRNIVSYNLVKSVIDTYVALITKDNPKISFETSGGDWSLQRRAKLLEKFVDGIAYETELEQIKPQIVRDSALWGVGIIKLYVDYSGPKPRIRIDRIRPGELLVDDQDAFYGSPSCIYQYKYVDRAALQDEYPDLRQALETATTSAFLDSSNYESASGVNLLDQVIVVEGWHLPRVPGPPEAGGSGDGRHTIACGNVVLEDEVWERPDFPFAILYRQRPVAGIWGQGIAEELQPLQLQITRIMLQIDRSQRLAVGHWLVEENANINTNAINDEIASIVRYRINKPEYVAFQPVSNDVYAYLTQLIGRGYEVIGVSQMSAAQQKPAGLNTGKALLVYADVQSQRLQPCYHEYQHWHVQIARQEITLAREAQEQDPNFEVKATGTKSMMRAVKWADANLKDEQFTLKLQPTNQLADDPAAKLSVIQDMINAGMITPDAGKRLLDMPDLEAYNAMENAPYDITMRTYERMVEQGDYLPPEPMMSPPQIQEAIRLMQLCYLRGRLDDVPRDRLLLVERWLSQAAANLPPPPPPPPPPGGPGAPPGPGGPALQQETQQDVQRDLARQAAHQLTGRA